MWAALLQRLLLPALLGLAERLIMSFFGWLKSRDEAARTIALGEQKARADRLAAEAQLNREMQDAIDRARAESDDAALRERLRATLGRGTTGDTGGGRKG